MSEQKPSIYAPKYHFYSPVNLSCLPGDPNGAIYWKGRYHLFFIFQNPDLPHGGHCWGHASSPNLIDWTMHPTALAPDEKGPDKGIYSGCALIDRHGTPTLVYYGIDAGCCIATSDDDELIHWTKSPHNPVIPETKDLPENDVYNIFDPHVWFDGEKYCGIFGSKRKPFLQGDCAYLFYSDDLIHWTYQRPFYTNNSAWTENIEDIACPDFFKLGNKAVLLGISHSHGARYYLGDYHHGTFVPKSHHRLTFPGGSLFAPESCLDDRQRRIVWFWMVNSQINPAEGYGSQIMALPRVMSLDSQNESVLWDIPEEYQRLRQNETSFGSLELLTAQMIRLPKPVGNSALLELDVPYFKGQLTIRVLESDDAKEYVSVCLDTERGVFSIDSSSCGNQANLNRRFPITKIYNSKFTSRDISRQVAPLILEDESPLHIQIYLDISIVELFINHRNCMSQLVYPEKTSRWVTLESDTKVTLNSCKSWQMEAITCSI